MQCDACDRIIIAFLESVKLKSRWLYEHSVCVGLVAMEIGEAINLGGDRIRLLEISGVLHDIGKISVRTDILMKPSGLNKAEWEQMKMHPILGAKALEPFAALAILKEAADIIMWHHENYNGTGYPLGKKSNEVPFESKIIKLCDIFVAMVSERPYKPSYPKQQAIKTAISSVDIEERYKTVIADVLGMINIGSLFNQSNAHYS